MMKSISSRQNAWFKRLRDAIREHRDEIVIEGPKAGRDAIAAGWKPIAIAVGVGQAILPVPADGQAILPVSADGQARLPVLQLTRELIDALSETRTPQKVLGLFERPQPSIDFTSTRPVVALDAVQDPGNVGTIVRLAAAFDAAGVVLLPGCADAFAPKAIRASAGAILSVPVMEMTIDGLPSRPLFYADAGGDAIAPPQGATLVFGSEGQGVSDAVRARGRAIAVATSGRVESLNVAASAAILLWQAFRSPAS